jgi:hypothetical protein
VKAVRLVFSTGLAAVAMLPFFTGPAPASGGIGCEARDARVALDIGIGMTRGSGGFFSVAGMLDVTSTDLPADLASLALDDKLIHSWVDGEELKLHFYHERSDGDFASLSLVIEAEAMEEGAYAGTYVVTAFGVVPAGGSAVDTWSIAGSVVCYAE